MAPEAMRRMCVAALTGENAVAREINGKLMALHAHLFVEANPIPVKWALAEMGRIQSGIRLPMTPLSPAWHEIVRGAMRAAGIE